MDGDGLEISFLDHVAIRVKDLTISAAWYETVLGLRKYQLPAWGEYPIFLLAGKSGVTLFPASLTPNPLGADSKNVRIDHFAFNVTRENFITAQRRFKDLNQEFELQDHYYFDSLYIKDPDGHLVELTTIKVDEIEFYRDK